VPTAQFFRVIGVQKAPHLSSRGLSQVKIDIQEDLKPISKFKSYTRVIPVRNPGTHWEIVAQYFVLDDTTDEMPSKFLRFENCQTDEDLLQLFRETAKFSTVHLSWCRRARVARRGSRRPLSSGSPLERTLSVLQKNPSVSSTASTRLNVYLKNL
jgi:hypothetical protein